MGRGNDAGEMLAAWAFVGIVIAGLVGYSYLGEVAAWIAAGIIAVAVIAFIAWPTRTTR